MPREYNIAKSAGQCAACGRPLEPGQEFLAVVRQADQELLRQDFCPACQDRRPQADDPAILGEWRARVAAPQQQKKKLFVDEETLLEFFRRLEGSEEPARVCFRFVLALVLMRKKRLAYEKADRLPDEREVWTLRLRGTDQTCQVIDPHMDEQRIAEVSRQLGDVLQGEL